MGPVYSRDKNFWPGKERKTQVKTGSLPGLRKQSWESRDIKPAGVHRALYWWGETCTGGEESERVTSRGPSSSLWLSIDQLTYVREPSEAKQRTTKRIGGDNPQTSQRLDVCVFLPTREEKPKHKIMEKKQHYTKALFLFVLFCFLFFEFYLFIIQQILITYLFYTY